MQRENTNPVTFGTTGMSAGVNQHCSYPCGPNGKALLHKVGRRVQLHHGRTLSPGGQHAYISPLFPELFLEYLHAPRPASCIEHGYSRGAPYGTSSHGDLSGLSYRCPSGPGTLLQGRYFSDCVAYSMQLSLSAVKLSLGDGDVLV
jgi:hypothetical protein